MEGTGCKECFGNTPANEICPDLSKLNPGSSRFPAMVLTHHLTATPSFPKRGLHRSLAYFAPKFVAAICCSDNTVVFEAAAANKLDKQPIQVWAGPLCGPQIAQQSEKAGKRQMELAPI